MDEMIPLTHKTRGILSIFHSYEKTSERAQSTFLFLLSEAIYRANRQSRYLCSAECPNTKPLSGELSDKHNQLRPKQTSP